MPRVGRVLVRLNPATPRPTAGCSAGAWCTWRLWRFRAGFRCRADGPDWGFNRASLDTACAMRGRLQMQFSNGWRGVRERSPDGFTMTRPEAPHSGVAVCEVWTNPIGWEMRLTIDGISLPITTV